MTEQHRRDAAGVLADYLATVGLLGALAIFLVAWSVA